MKRICIVGAGAAGLLVLLNLEAAGIDPSSITVVDPTHMGGDLKAKWSSVRSNTTWRQIFEAVPSRNSFAHPWSHLDPESPVELRYVIEYLRLCAKEYLSKVILRTDTVSSVDRQESGWKISLAHSKEPILSEIVFFCQGASPKQLDLPFPSIPLEIALTPTRLAEYVKPGQHVLVFGTAHSGPLVVRNLVDLGVKVTNFYVTEKPFYFAKEGHYDGIKYDAETIALKILEGGYPSVSMESVHDLSSIIRASKTADACVYACGFERRGIGSSWSLYDGSTGQMEGTTTAWGFGIAYPNRAPDGPEGAKPQVYWDVSVPAFQAHIKAQMPSILAALQES